MRVLIIAALVFIAILGFGTFTYYYVGSTSAVLLDKASTLGESVEAEDWHKARDNFKNLSSSWGRTSTQWTILLDHQELDNINITLSRIKEFINTRDKSGSMSEIAELKLLLKHVPEKEAVSLKNIL